MVIGVVSGDVLEETVAAHEKGYYWRIDYTKDPVEAVLINAAGQKRGVPKTVDVEPTQHGGFRLVEPKNNNQVIVEYIPWWASPGPGTAPSSLTSAQAAGVRITSPQPPIGHP
jgi:hypothetical protein